MWELIFRSFIGRLLGRLWLIVLFPALIVIATPIILLRGALLACRHTQKFRFAVSDGYAFMWDMFCEALS
jgi:hypothetical protein